MRRIAFTFLFLAGSNAVAEETMREKWERECRSGSDGYACTQAATEFETVDPSHAEQLYLYGCETYRGKDCGGLASYADKIGRRGDSSKALDFMARACTVWPDYPCTMLADWFESGRFGPKDLARALELYRRACDAGSVGCADAARLYHKGGPGLAKNPEREKEYQAKSAAFQEKADAAVEASRLELAKSPAQQKMYRDFEAACRAGKYDQCNTAAYGVELTNPALALELWTFGCKREAPAALGYRPNCVALVSFAGKLLKKGRVEEAKDAAIIACTDEPYGCAVLGDWFRDAILVPRDLARAAKLYQLACDRDQETGCRRLAGLYESGEGVKKDLKKSKALAAKASQIHAGTVVKADAQLAELRKQQTEQEYESDRERRQRQAKEVQDIEQRRIQKEQMEAEDRRREAAHRAEMARIEAQIARYKEEEARKNEENRELATALLEGLSQVAGSVGGIGPSARATAPRSAPATVAAPRSAPRAAPLNPGKADNGGCKPFGGECRDNGASCCPAFGNEHPVCFHNRCCSGVRQMCNATSDCCEPLVHSCQRQASQGLTVCCLPRGAATSEPGDCCNGYDPGASACR